METIITDWENVKTNINKTNELEIYLTALVKLTVGEYIDIRKEHKKEDVPKDGQ